MFCDFRGFEESGGVGKVPTFLGNVFEPLGNKIKKLMAYKKCDLIINHHLLYSMDLAVAQWIHKVTTQKS